MLKKLNIILLGILVMAANASYAAKIHPKAGTTSAPFLKLGIGARAIAMGQSFVAVADDATAPEWNPAGTSSILYRQVVAMHHIHFQGISQDFVGYVNPSNKWTWAVAVRGLFYPNDLERRSGLGEGIPEDPLTEFTDKFGGNDISFALNMSKKFQNGVNAGVNLKFIRQKIDVETGSTFAVDLGLLSDFPYYFGRPWENMSWGAVLQNLGPGIKFIERSYELPLNIKAGVAYRPMQDKLTVAFDYNHSIDNYPYISIGSEWNFYKMMTLRSGYRYKGHGNDLGALSGLSAGMGFSFLADSSLDYAFLPQGDLGNTHRISMKLSFGRRKKVVPVKVKLPGVVKADKLVFEKTELKEDVKKLVLRRKYSNIEAVPKGSAPFERIVFYTEYPAGRPCPVNIEYAKITDLSGSLERLVPKDAVQFAAVAFRHNLKRLLAANMKIFFAVDNEWLSLHKLEPGGISLISSSDGEIKAAIADTTEDEIIFEAHLESLPDYLIFIGSR